MMHEFSIAVPPAFVLTELRDPQAGATGLFKVLDSPLEETEGGRGLRPQIIRPALSPLRHENLCIIPARKAWGVLP
jgi:hypothetical protein